MSIAGGLHRAFERLKEVRGDAMQIFLKNERQWITPETGPEAIALFRKSWQEAGGVPIAAHDTYLINLAGTDVSKIEKSITAFADELKRAEALGIPWLVMHPGSHLGMGTTWGIKQLTCNLDRAIEVSATAAVKVLVENTAGQGTQLGATFEEIASIFSSSSYSDRLGMCFDTCHAFAAGYDIRTNEQKNETFSKLEKTVGIKHLSFFHLNDSKKDLGSRVDRHEHIGRGKIGIEAFRLILNDVRFSSLPMVIETPKENGLEEDKKNLRLLRSLLVGNEGEK